MPGLSRRQCNRQARAVILALVAAPPAVTKAAAAPKHEQNVRAAEADGFHPRAVLDRPSAPPAARPESTPKAAVDNGIARTTLGLSVAGGLLAFAAGIAAMTRAARRHGRAGIAA